MKTCGKCKLEKPFEDFSKNKSTKDGLASYCKSCKAKAARGSRDKHKKAISDRKKEKYRNDSDYREAAKARADKTRKAFTQIDIDRRNKYRRDRYAADPTQRKLHNKRWRDDNPDKIHAKVHRRLAVKHATVSDEWERAEVFESAGWKCFYCGVDVGPRGADNKYRPNEAQADHFTPLNNGGTNERKNIVCSCGRCNIRKSDKNPFEFIRDNINQLED